MPDTEPGCTCNIPKGSQRVCRCTCGNCGSKDLKWEKWGVYLDKDLVCQVCNHVQDYWDC